MIFPMSDEESAITKEDEARVEAKEASEVLLFDLA
jgi:hypothetical protein